MRVAVVGAGIVGLATARELARRGHEVVVLERERDVGLHQTARNSGVVHAGVYYPPGSLKARLCVEGARELYAYCEERGIPAERGGKLIVAVDEGELPRLDELERRGRANGVPGLRRLDAGGLREVEPHATGIAALHSPATGTVDFAAVARALRDDVEAAGGEVRLGAEVRETSGLAPCFIHLAGGERIACDRAVFCAGAAADRLAVASGGPPDPRIVPFRGAYMRMRRPELVRSMIYPVPDPALPFLGVHLTRHGDELLLGPTALLTGPLGRSLAWPGTWRLASRHWQTGVTEIRRRLSRAALARAAARYVPGITAADLEPAFSGVRAQALARDGTLVDDFVVSEARGAVHVRNAPSPAATSCLALARLIAERAT